MTKKTAQKLKKPLAKKLQAKKPQAKKSQAKKPQAKKPQAKKTQAKKTQAPKSQVEETADFLAETMWHMVTMENFPNHQIEDKILKGWEKVTICETVTEFRKGQEVLVRLRGYGASHLFTSLRNIRRNVPIQKKMLEQEHHLLDIPDVKESDSEMAEYLKKTYREAHPDLDERCRSGEISQNEMIFLFKEGDQVYLKAGARGGVFKSLEFTLGFFGSYFRWELQVLELGPQGQLVESVKEFRTPVEGVLNRRAPVETYPVVALTDEIRNRLTLRGSKVNEYVDGTYLNYQGNIFSTDGWSVETFRADGRVMVDCTGLARYQPDLARNLYGRSRSDDNNNDDKSEELVQKSRGISPDRLWMAPPNLGAYSLSLKKWGRIQVDGLSQVAFRENVMDRLVLDDDRKKSLMSLIGGYAENRDLFQDLIEGKGSGLVFLLHGPPGVGKTLTAEVVAETLKQPLYSVSTGELGVTPEQVEEKLREVLDLAVRWNAIVLVDEADIFLETRTNDGASIVRNAIVGVFLKLLEYHQGVVFLTTNRAHQIDSAVLSRVTMAFTYPAMCDRDLRIIWTNLFRSKQIVGINLDKVIHAGQVNGRVAKTIFRTALLQAAHDRRGVTTVDLVRGVEQYLAFQAQVSPTR